MSFEMSGKASVRIAAAPELIYALVTDVTRMGEWSPECAGGEWTEGASGPTVGAQFHGHNARGDNQWTTPNTVLAAEPGREFAWVVGTADFQVCRWRFEFAPADGGTDVTESFELGDQAVGFASTVAEAPEEQRAALIETRRKQLVDDMHETLKKLKECVETS